MVGHGFDGILGKGIHSRIGGYVGRGGVDTVVRHW